MRISSVARRSVWYNSCDMRKAQFPASPVFLAVALSLASLVALALADAEGASAHGGGFTLDKRADAGPYALRLGTIPRALQVGEGILIIEALDASAGERVSAPDASVVISPQRPDGSATPYGDLQAFADSYDPTLYESNVNLDVEGEWTFIVTVSGDAGTGTARFALGVERPNPLGGVIVLFVLLVLLTIAGLAVRASLKKKTGGARE